MSYFNYSYIREDPISRNWAFRVLYPSLFKLSFNFLQVPLFENTDLAFIRLLCTKVKPAHFHASEYIVRKGDIGQEMFIIRKGLVRKLSRYLEHCKTLHQPRSQVSLYENPGKEVNASCGGQYLKADLDGTIFAYDYRARLASVMTSRKIVLCKLDPGHSCDTL